MNFEYELRKFADEIYLDEALAKKFKDKIDMLIKAADEFSEFEQKYNELKTEHDRYEDIIDEIRSLV